MAPEVFGKIDWGAAEAPLSKQEIEESLLRVQGWRLLGEAIEKSFEFEDFKHAIDFINNVAREAVAQNHHPSIQLWNITHVKISIKTLCINGLSKLDFILASAIDKLPSPRSTRDQPAPS
jgi:4a-hydroxytetrahydrobiopterin dehydratase